MNNQIGADILSLVIQGMYSNPLLIYREYLQNAADSIEASSTPDNGKVEINLDIIEKSVTIRDNGPGLSYVQAKQQLLSISKSLKSHKRDRGFRGIGRLSGLAFGKSVTFLTRTIKDKSITKVVWDGEKLKNGIEQKLPVDEIIQSSVTIEKLIEGDYPENFFEVKISGISRYATSSIFNQDMVKKYLGEVCPVPFSLEFPYEKNISNLLKKNPLHTLEVHLNEDKEPITRLQENNLPLANNSYDEYIQFEKIQIPTLNGNGHVAEGWIAHSSYLGALPKGLGIRCLRARMGNIQIGDETIFDHLFSENRFNRWCVAEIYILDSNIIPNAKRDYFEPNAHLRNLENHLSTMCAHWERECRAASSKRNLQKHFDFFIKKLESTYEIAAGGYLTIHESKTLVSSKVSEISMYREKHAISPEHAERLDIIENNLLNFNPHRNEKKLAGVSYKKAEVLVYQKVFKILTEKMSSPQQAKDMIDAIIENGSVQKLPISSVSGDGFGANTG